MGPDDFTRDMLRAQARSRDDIRQYGTDSTRTTSARSTDVQVNDPDWATCEACQRWPAIPLRIRSTGGYIVYRTLKSTKMVALCKECGLAALHSGQTRSAVGVATFNLFAPYALAQNEKWILRLRRLPDPLPLGAVVYDTRDWSSATKAALTKALTAAGIPYEWMSGDLVVDETVEKVADKIVDKVAPSKDEKILPVVPSRPLSHNVGLGSMVDKPGTPTVPGWYLDPEDPSRERWWYGDVWSPDKVRHRKTLAATIAAPSRSGRLHSLAALLGLLAIVALAISAAQFFTSPSTTYTDTSGNSQSLTCISAWDNFSDTGARQTWQQDIQQSGYTNAVNGSAACYSAIAGRDHTSIAALVLGLVLILGTFLAWRTYLQSRRS